jgi:septal ring factor EnvC (AmiA/AmiB activator)
MILTTCKYFDLVGNRCSRVTDGKCNDLQDCEFKYIAELKKEISTLQGKLDAYQMSENEASEIIAELKAENEKLKEENYQLQKDCQICENFIDFIPCKPIRDMDYDLQNVINQRDKYIKTLREIKTIAEAPKPFIDFSEIKTATEVEYDYAAICNELELRLHKVLEFITKAEEE